MPTSTRLLSSRSPMDNKSSTLVKSSSTKTGLSDMSPSGCSTESIEAIESQARRLCRRRRRRWCAAASFVTSSSEGNVRARGPQISTQDRTHARNRNSKDTKSNTREVRFQKKGERKVQSSRGLYGATSHPTAPRVIRARSTRTARGVSRGGAHLGSSPPDPSRRAVGAPSGRIRVAASSVIFGLGWRGGTAVANASVQAPGKGARRPHRGGAAEAT